MTGIESMEPDSAVFRATDGASSGAKRGVVSRANPGWRDGRASGTSGDDSEGDGSSMESEGGKLLVPPNSPGSRDYGDDVTSGSSTDSESSIEYWTDPEDTEVQFRLPISRIGIEKEPVSDKLVPSTSGKKGKGSDKHTKKRGVQSIEGGDT